MRSLLLFSLGCLLVAEEAPLPRLADFVVAAPEVQEAREAHRADGRAAGAADRLPDPMLRLGRTRFRTDHQTWPSSEIALEQALPRWGERDARRVMAEAGVQRSAAALRQALGEVAAEAATLLAEAAAAHARLALTEARLARVTALESVVAAQVAAGGRSGAGTLAARSLRATLVLEVQDRQREIADAEQEVRSLLGLAPEAPLPTFAAPDPGQIGQRSTPAQDAAAAGRREAEAGFLEARAGRYPETAVGLRFERENAPDETMTAIGLEVSVSLPVWQGAASDLEDAALARQRAAGAATRMADLRAKALISRAQRAMAVATQAHTAAQEASTRLTAEQDALGRTIGTDNGPSLTEALDLLDRLAEAEDRRIAAHAEAQKAQAQLWRLAPPSLPAPELP